MREHTEQHRPQKPAGACSPELLPAGRAGEEVCADAAAPSAPAAACGELQHSGRSVRGHRQGEDLVLPAVPARARPPPAAAALQISTATSGAQNAAADARRVLDARQLAQLLQAHPAAYHAAALGSCRRIRTCRLAAPCTQARALLVRAGCWTPGGGARWCWPSCCATTRTSSACRRWTRRPSRATCSPSWPPRVSLPPGP